ncbi:MAG TPA: PEP-CTERM sorting domain-containing protein [Fimbriimonadaceae bacterium]|nr:PEP-CTERM sorting domain-containing protein [Fimbriimonadaceae bacterium]
MSISGGVMTNLGTLPGGDNSYATGINEAGQISGYSSAATHGPVVSFLYSGGTMTNVGTLGGSSSQAFGINATGQMAGYSLVGGDAYDHAYLYSSGVMHDLGTLTGGNSYGYGLNDAGQVVGDDQSPTNVNRAFVWSGGTMTDLNTLLDSSGAGWSLSSAFGISDSGEIVGYGNIDGIRHGFLLTPVPEPATLTGFGCALVGLIARRRRRSDRSRSELRPKAPQRPNAQRRFIPG